jgi:hypothetical protein
MLEAKAMMKASNQAGRENPKFRLKTSDIYLGGLNLRGLFK